MKDSLQLTEVWRGEVVGGELQRAGLEGGVRRRLAPYGLQAARFRLLPAPAGVVNSCLRVAAMNRDFAEQLGPEAPATPTAGSSGASGDGSSGSDGDGGFLARFTQASVGCCYLQYTCARCWGSWGSRALLDLLLLLGSLGCGCSLHMPLSACMLHLAPLPCSTSLPVGCRPWRARPRCSWLCTLCRALTLLRPGAAGRAWWCCGMRPPPRCPPRCWT